MIEKIVKRDGKVVPFNSEKITNAIYKAMLATGGQNLELAQELSEKVVEKLKKSLKKGEIPAVEQVQDIVEQSS
ncbi:MAG: ATP cone domain-containing protein [Persephonella sp.]|nr:ATP cone domain-containing protein [Persephonella sp.]